MARARAHPDAGADCSVPIRFREPVVLAGFTAGGEVLLAGGAVDADLAFRPRCPKVEPLLT
ncbi:MAG TPA: hypothetical protein VMT69_11225 [Kineosporiaceae bacterium]|nr:hypothetical protein [Kineosporiaceae bacterium]